MLKDPVLYSWVTEQINKDWDEKADTIRVVLDELRPWLNYELFQAIEKQKKKEEQKILTLAKTSDINKVETVNTFDVFMKSLGVKTKDE